MAKRRVPADERQEIFPWARPDQVVRLAGSGAVIFEAPELSRIVRSSTPLLPRVQQRRAPQLQSLGLPFGLRTLDGGWSCWSCARDLTDADVVRAGPGYTTCPGCGARLPFTD